MKKYLLPLLAILLFAACEKEIEFDGDTSASQVVLVSQPEADSVWMVKLTYSRFFLSEKPFQSIDDAVVTLWVNDAPAGTAVAKGDGIYNTGITPQAGDSLRLSVCVPGSETVTAACRIPARPQVHKLELVGDTLLNTIYYDYDSIYYDTVINYNLALTIDDPAGTANYYAVSLQRYDEASAQWRSAYCSVDDNVLFPDGATDDLISTDDGSAGYQVLFTDENINGTRHTLRISSSYVSMGSTRLVVQALSRDLYLYTKTRNSQSDSDLSFLSEPVQIQCNVLGGIGILGGSATVYYTFRL